MIPSEPPVPAPVDLPPSPFEPPPRRRRWIWAIVAIALIAIAALWYVWPRATEQQATTGRGRFDASRVMPVVAAPATTGSIDVTSTAN